MFRCWQTLVVKPELLALQECTIAIEKDDKKLKLADNKTNILEFFEAVKEELVDGTGLEPVTLAL